MLWFGKSFNQCHKMRWTSNPTSYCDQVGWNRRLFLSLARRWTVSWLQRDEFRNGILKKVQLSLASTFLNGALSVIIVHKGFGPIGSKTCYSDASFQYLRFNVSPTFTNYVWIIFWVCAKYEKNCGWSHAVDRLSQNAMCIFGRLIAFHSVLNIIKSVKHKRIAIRNSVSQR